MTAPFFIPRTQMFHIAMLDQIELKRSSLDELCRRFCVRRLELFGSAVSDRFDPGSSDLDFLVQFEPHSPMGPFHQFIDFKLTLEQLFGRSVDLVELTAIRNPYFRSALERSRRMLLYVA